MLWLLFIVFFSSIGNYYFVGCDYTNKIGFLSLFSDQRNHLIDFRDGHQPTTPKQLFNIKLSSACNVIK